MYVLLGYVHLPIFKNIDYRSCISDTLHMFLRITDKLEEYLLEAINEADLKMNGNKYSIFFNYEFYFNYN